uniref:G2 and S-phase expressed 1 n=1 Tax=Leptobrachium leishanense TaxID=445787 RepID=A0A8C5MTL4_9ANUR
MDAAGGFCLLTDEKFDFDLSLSPKSAKDNEDCDDDEVFIGPVKHKEKCIRAAISSRESKERTPPQMNDVPAWSPLSGDKFVEIFKEAHLLALQLESFASDDQKEEPPPPEPATNQAVEKFVQESKSKLKLFEAGLECMRTPVVVKRETYCVQDSPFHQLPPSVQKRLAVPSTEENRSSSAESSKQSSPGRGQKNIKTLSVSPLAQKTKALQPKTNLPAANTSKLAASRMQNSKALTTHLQKNRLTVEKLKTSKKRSPVRQKNLSSADSFEDLLSDKSSYASDVSDTSLNNSAAGQNKRSLPAVHKANVKQTEFKAPGYGAFRKNTSSSSSSHSSLNTSLNSSSAFSPPSANGKLNASLNTSVNGSKAKTNPSRLALVRPNGGSASSLKTTTTNTANNQRPSGALKVKTAIGSKPSAAAVAQPQTPAGKFQRQTSAPNLQRLPAPGKPEVKEAPASKPLARVLQTPTRRLKLPQKAGGLSPEQTAAKTIKPARLLSCGEIERVIVESTPMSDKQGAQPGFGKSTSATPSAKRLSALPTPINRRMSSVFTTPRTIPRSFGFVRQTLAQQAPANSAAKPPVTGNGESEGKKLPAPVSPCSPMDEDAPSAADICCSLNFSPESKESVKPSEPRQPLPAPATSEALLVDIGLQNNWSEAKVRKHSLMEFDTQPLIDLSNTPDLSKRAMKPTYVGQLIDLSSPLIKLSPVVNKENVDFDSPLLKF